MNKEDTEKLFAQVAENDKLNEQCRQEGIDIGRGLLKKHTHTVDYPLEFGYVDDKPIATESEPRELVSCDSLAIVLSNIMNQIVTKDVDDDSASLLSIEWAFENFWGLQIEKALPDINDLYQRLVDGGHDKNNHYVYNDLDYSLWYEDVKPEDGRSYIKKRSVLYGFSR